MLCTQGEPPRGLTISMPPPTIDLENQIAVPLTRHAKRPSITGAGSFFYAKIWRGVIDAGNGRLTNRR